MMENIPGTDVKIFNILDGLYKIALGDGDLTTEIIEPYGKWARFHIRTKREITPVKLSLIENWIISRNDDLTIEVLVKDGEVVPEGKTVMIMEGNGRTAISLFGFLNPLLSRLWSLYARGKKISEEIVKLGYTPVLSPFSDPCYGLLDRLILVESGFTSFYSSIDDSIYIRPVHINWVSEPSRLRDNIEEQFGGKRHGFRIQVEVNNQEQFRRLNEDDFQRVHARCDSMEELQAILKIAKHPGRIVAHVFKIESLRTLVEPLGTKWVSFDLIAEGGGERLLEIDTNKEKEK